MDIKPIRTETDYEAALKEIENLWGASPAHMMAIALRSYLLWLKHTRTSVMKFYPLIR